MMPFFLTAQSSNFINRESPSRKMHAHPRSCPIIHSKSVPDTDHRWRDGCRPNFEEFVKSLVERIHNFGYREKDYFFNRLRPENFPPRSKWPVDGAFRSPPIAPRLAGRRQNRREPECRISSIFRPKNVNPRPTALNQTAGSGIDQSDRPPPGSMEPFIVSGRLLIL